ncbi:short-chain dehydrogenase [Flavobacterium akiainvivens]|uniref:Short-chain dehydrogenase n=2 Tax=Flavobacterium akiainvivens TaxID=1202724 RepID=A0A0M8MLT0_9FLAO|nr:short-chain dehydrogenase [Flavobacterium akiainvivens]
MQTKPSQFPPQHQRQPGFEHDMNPEPEIISDSYKASGRLLGKVALITGGDSGIGRSVAVHFAREGANVCIVYYDEHRDAEITKRLVEAEGRKCIIMSGDLKNEDFCRKAVIHTAEYLGGINILVNNAAVQFPQKEFKDITGSQVRETFETNILPFFYMTREALNYLKEGDSIINTTSVTAYRGSVHLIDYSSTKGAIVAFTRSTSGMLAEKGIRVNGVAPGPIWTPLIPASFEPEHVAKFGQDTPMKRAGQPSEVGPAYVFLASTDASYITGQIIHVNGGEMTES